MFTGIIEELGEVASVERLPDSARLLIRSPLVTSEAQPGESISVNGVCLTVVTTRDDCFTTDVMRETLDRSSFRDLAPLSKVNLERAMRLGDRLGGHLVQGHVDATASILDRTSSEHWDSLRIELPAALARYVVRKGSITVDGVSLTVADVEASSFVVGLIPTTLDRTTLGSRQVGDLVNLEVDVIAKYVETLVTPAHRDGQP